MKSMCFKLYHNPEKKTLVIPRAALQLSGLSDVEELLLNSGDGYVLTTKYGLDTRECVHFLKFLFSTSESLLAQLAAESNLAMEDDEFDSDEWSDNQDDMEDEFVRIQTSVTVPHWMLKLAGLNRNDGLEIYPENGKVTITTSSEAENITQTFHKEAEDPLASFDDAFLNTLMMAGVNMDGLAILMRQEEGDHA